MDVGRGALTKSRFSKHAVRTSGAISAENSTACRRPRPRAPVTNGYVSRSLSRPALRRSPARRVFAKTCPLTTSFTTAAATAQVSGFPP